MGNATWAGAPLAPLLREAGVRGQGKEIVFWGHDVGKQTVRELDLTAPFARSMSIPDAMNPDNLLCYEMNGAPAEHTVTSRATDMAGNVQPDLTDPRIANKRTYWESNGQITRRVQVA